MGKPRRWAFGSKNDSKNHEHAEWRKNAQFYLNSTRTAVKRAILSRPTCSKLKDGRARQ